MGGDDLGSDDEYFAAPIRADVSDDEDDSVEGKERGGAGTKKRKQADGGKIDGNDDLEGPSSEKTKKQKKKQHRGDGSQQKLRSYGHRIVQESVSKQAELLSEFTGVSFASQNIVSERPDQQQKQPQKSDDGDGDGNDNDFSASERLISFISKKQLKKPCQGPKSSSPRVLILSISARRAVAILKELAPLKIQIAKLFPKQGSCQEQARQLAESNFCVAVGTPQRLSELLQRDALRLNQTQLVLLDTFQNDKQFSVYTLPDTSKFCVDILKEHVHSECTKRPKRIKVGFL